MLTIVSWLSSTIWDSSFSFRVIFSAFSDYLSKSDYEIIYEKIFRFFVIEKINYLFFLKISLKIKNTGYFLFVWYILKRLSFLQLFSKLKSSLFSNIWTYTRKHSMNEIPHRLDLWTFTRFVDKPRFVDGFLANEKSTNRVMHCIHIWLIHWPVFIF